MLNKITLRRSIRSLQSMSGFHTGLLSLYVPASKTAQDIIAYLENEIVESENIKDKSNRSHVISNLTSALN